MTPTLGTLIGYTDQTGTVRKAVVNTHDGNDAGVELAYATPVDDGPAECHIQANVPQGAPGERGTWHPWADEASAGQ